MIPVPADGGQVPGYVVWDAQLESQFKHLNELFQTTLRLAKLPETLFAVSETGGAASGTALSLRSMPMQMKLEGLRRLWERVWLRMGAEVYSVADMKPTWPTPGLPGTKEEAETEAKRIESGTTTVEEAKGRLDRNG